MHSSSAQNARYFDDSQYTEKKRKELRLKALVEKIKEAEEQVHDYSVFLCSVSPDQTMVELEALRGSLRWDSQEYTAVGHLSASIRRCLNRCTSLDSRARWEQIACVADDVCSAAVSRRDECNLQRVRTTGSASPPKAAIPFVAARRSSEPREVITPPLSTPPPPPQIVSPPATTFAPESPSRPLPQAPGLTNKRTPLLSPLKEDAEERQGPLKPDEFTSVLGTPFQKVTQMRQYNQSMVSPQLSVDRDVDVGQLATAPARDDPFLSTRYPTGDYMDTSPAREDEMQESTLPVRNPSPTNVFSQFTHRPYDDMDAVHNNNTSQAAGVVPLTSHALAQREIRAVEQHYEARLDTAHAQWRHERNELVVNMERMEMLLKEQHSLEKADLADAWNRERVSLLQGQNELRDDLRSSKEYTRELEDQLDKLKQVVAVLGQRLEASEERSNALQDQHRVLHETLTRAVASAPSLSSRTHGSPPGRLPSDSGPASHAELLRSMGLIGVGDVTTVSGGLRSPLERARSPALSDAQDTAHNRHRAGSFSSYETVSPGPKSPTTAVR